MPKVFFIIATYNQGRYIRDAVHAAFAQAFSPLTIIISDDCSTDNTFAIIQNEVSAYAGKHEIILNQNAQNLGLAKHINAIMDMIDADDEPALVVAAAGDDISLPDRTQKLYEVWEQYNFATLSMFSNMSLIDASGQDMGVFSQRSFPSNHLTTEAFSSGICCGVFGSSQAYTTDILHQFGHLSYNITREDVVLPFRASLIGSVLYISEPLVKYRRHGANMWELRYEMDTVEKHFMHLKKHAQTNVDIFNQQLTDLEKSRQYLNECSFDKIRNDLRIRRERFVVDQALIEASSLIKRLYILLATLATPRLTRKVPHLFVKFLMPKLYLHLMKRKHALLQVKE